MQTTATITQAELDQAGTLEGRLELLKSKGIPIKGNNLNTDDYYIEMRLHKSYVYSWEEI